MNAKRVAASLLMIFTWVSVGYALARVCLPRTLPAEVQPAAGAGTTRPAEAAGAGPSLPEPARKFLAEKGLDAQTIQTVEALLAGQSASQGPQDKVVVYYMHMTFRCADCNLVETLTDELVRTRFADDLRQGRLEFKSVDYMKNKEMARRYDIGGNSVVVAEIRQGKETRHVKLGEVMSRKADRDGFFDYVGSAIRACLPGGGT